MASMITTLDNPFDPFEEWDQWFNWDMVHGYNTPSLLARVLITSEALSEADQETDREQAMKEIVKENLSGRHVIVTRA